MIKGIYTSASGMLPRMLKQEIFANNMANVNTVGFKKDGVFLRQLKQAQDGLITDLDWEIPMIDDVYIDFSQGQLHETQQPLDVAIEGDGFFAIGTPDGERYTRNGQFSLTPEGTLVDKNGFEVLSDAGPITISGDVITVSEDGTIAVDGSSVAKIKIVDFEKPYNFRKEGLGYFAVDGETGPASLSENYQIRQGYVEQSNVNIIEQMVDMLISFRAFQAGQKAINSQDETLDKAVNDLGRV